MHCIRIPQYSCKPSFGICIQAISRVKKFNSLLDQLNAIKGYTEVMQVAERKEALPPELSKVCSDMREVVDPILRETLNDLRFQMAMPHCS